MQSLYCQIILFFVGYDGVFSQTMEDRCFFSQVIQPVDVLHSWKAALNGQGLVPRTVGNGDSGLWEDSMVTPFCSLAICSPCRSVEFQGDELYNFEVQPLLNKFAKHLKKSSNSD